MKSPFPGGSSGQMNAPISSKTESAASGFPREIPTPGLSDEHLIPGHADRLGNNHNNNSKFVFKSSGGGGEREDSFLFRIHHGKECGLYERQ